ncbi:MAG TPA: phosphatase PAP2 family protein [Chitinophagaceae bacterium]|nr:phosphatase PAP2 family protein [Chitinophagaceae bacterium]
MIRFLRTNIKKLWAELALLSLESLIVIVLFIIALFIFVFITRQVFVIRENQFDFRIFELTNKLVSERTNKIILFFTFLGTHLFLIPANIVLIAYFLFIKKHRWFSIRIPVVAISSLLMMTLLKLLFHRHRPDLPLLREARGLSFPSGHAFMSMTFYGLLIYITIRMVKNPWLKWTLAVLLMLLILTIGFTRIYLRVHYPSDVLAGFATGFLWLVFSLKLLRRIEHYTRRKVDVVVGPDPIIQITAEKP